VSSFCIAEDCCSLASLTLIRRLSSVTAHFVIINRFVVHRMKCANWWWIWH